MGKVKQWSVEKKDAIEKILISMWATLCMDIPSNYEDIVQYCYEDVCETADPINWSDGDVVIAFRRWIESPNIHQLSTGIKSENGNILREGDTIKIPVLNSKPLYFEIVHQGWNKDLMREEIQIHCGENGNLFIVKTDIGFTVDVYNQEEFVDSMPIYHDDLDDIPDIEI